MLPTQAVGQPWGDDRERLGVMRHNSLLIWMLAILAVAALCSAAPEPSLVPKNWELNFRYRDPERIAVTVPGRAKPVIYWYMLYTVENPGDEGQEFTTGSQKPGESEIEKWSRIRFAPTSRPAGGPPKFYPTFTIVTDTLQVVESEIGVSPEAFRAIQRRWNNPLLLPASKMNGEILVGADRARHGVAIWPDFDPKAREFTVYITGLSGETARIANPAFNAKEPVGPRNPRVFILHKTLSAPYRLPGGSEARALAVPERLSREPMWVMR